MTDEPETESELRFWLNWAWGWLCFPFVWLHLKWLNFRTARIHRRIESNDVELARRVAHLPREERWKFYADMDAEIAEVKRKLEADRAAGKPPPRG